MEPPSHWSQDSPKSRGIPLQVSRDLGYSPRCDDVTKVEAWVKGKGQTHTGQGQGQNQHRVTRSRSNMQMRAAILENLRHPWPLIG